MGVFVVSDCANTLSCVGFADAVGGGAVSNIAFGLDGLTAGAYWARRDSLLWSEVEPSRGLRNWASLSGLEQELTRDVL